ncbi:hypothetical protein Tco_0048447, partial [Tanacetum coccineum]
PSWLLKSSVDRTWWSLHIENQVLASGYGVLGLLDTAYWMEIVLHQNVDQSILYSVSADVDTSYSFQSGNGLDLV